MRVNSEVGSVGDRDSRSVRGAGDFGEKNKKKKKTHKGNQHGQGGGGGGGGSSNKKQKSSSKGGKSEDQGVRFGQSKDKYSSHLFKSCGNLLEKLMKHKFGWVFNVPVDVKGLGLLDYNSIIKHPMDLGTVRNRLNKTWYKSAMEFAEDVRLTFNNAMLYNPKGQDVHSMAEQLLKIFEDKWAVIEKEFNLNKQDDIDDHEQEEEEEDDDDDDGAPTRVLPPHSIHSLPAMRGLDRAESVTKPVAAPNSVAAAATAPVPKKPKAMDAHKRDMTYEEKQMLSTSLQNLPSEKLDNVVQIIKKRTPGLSQQEDEIEVDIASLEAETLWELDRFVTSYKKSLMSSSKRKAEVVFQSRANDSGGRGVEKRNMAPSAVEIRKGSITDSDNDGNSAYGSQ